MCHEPTELLWIGCLTGLIWIPRFRFVHRYQTSTRRHFDQRVIRDEWNNLLHLFNISHFSSTCCAKSSSLIGCLSTMAKRMQEQKGEERIVVKSKPTPMNLSSVVPTSSSSATSPIASKRPGILTASGKPESRIRINSKFDAAWGFSSAAARCTPWRVNGYSNGETCRIRRGVREFGQFRI